MIRLGALTLGQRVKRDLASHGKNRGSRAGEHEQPNAGRKRKRHLFFLRFVGRTLSHARRQGVTRKTRTCENRTRKASRRTRGHPQTSQNRSPGAPKRLWAPSRASKSRRKPFQDALGTLRRHAMTRPGGSVGAPGPARAAPTASGEPPGTHRKAAETR